MGGAYVLKRRFARAHVRRSKCNLGLMGGARISNYTLTLLQPYPQLYPIPHRSSRGEELVA